MGTEFQELRSKIYRHDSLEKELANFERFQSMLDLNCAGITIIKHYTDDCTINLSSRNQQMSSGGFSTTFIKRNITNIEATKC